MSDRQDEPYFGPPLPPNVKPTNVLRANSVSNNSSSQQSIIYDDDSVTRYDSRRPKGHTFRRVQRVSRHAALATKQQLWDSNAISIDAALSAVDQWEAGYNALRGLMVASVHSAQGLYGAAKEGAGRLEHGLLLPLRDWILLPAFGGVERAAVETVKFFQSNAAHQAYGQGLQLAKTVPVVGENILAPAIHMSVQFLQRTWEIAQYPIPSKQQVIESVDFALNGTKWALTTAGREIFLYVKRADAIITRTLSHTQWKVLGSGPYATLDKLNKREVIDHLCERYFSLMDPVARYELAAHVRLQNRPLYHDLVLTGVLKERGGDLTKDDEWLSTCPSYRSLEEPFLIRSEETVYGNEQISPLWFRLPNVNGKRPGKDAPWICFRKSEIKVLEDRYHQVIKDGQTALAPAVNTVIPESEDIDPASMATPLKSGSGGVRMLGSSGSSSCSSMSSRNVDRTSRYPTVAKWYVPDVEKDVLVDQKRAAVSFFVCCPKCREPYGAVIPPMVSKMSGDLCDNCQKQAKEMPSVAALLTPPPISMVMRPTLWRFHGEGDAVRRATWLLDTARNGLQPFDEEAASILEDAYLFLKWMSLRQALNTDGLEGALLTVEVPCPDGTERLVQFSSLTRATAIQKGLGAAVAVFKRRVYRGAWLEDVAEPEEREPTIEESIMRAVEDHGALGDTMVPDMSIRSVLTPKSAPPRRTRSPSNENRLVLYSEGHGAAASLAVPEFVLEEKMLTYLKEEKDGKIDHLVLIVHGIGEMLRSIDVFGLALPNLSTIIDCCAYLRKNHEEVQEAHFSNMYPSADAISLKSTGRVEYLPVEWHEAFSILSQRRKSGVDEGDEQGRRQRPYNVMMDDISLRTIPNMRDFANDTLLDVLYFMSPEHASVIIDVVANEMNVIVEKFRTLTGFNGRISIAGHSLGSIISWDILSHQRDVSPSNRPGIPGVSSLESIETVSGYFSPATERSYVYGYAPELTQVMNPSMPTFPSPSSTFPQLDFRVDNFFLLGSPLAVFLMIRNQRKPLSEDFYLPGCERVMNIFHPYDPVAYRIEPCIDPRNAEFEPSIMKHWNGGFRVHYQTKRLWRQLMETTWKTQQDVVEAFEASMAAMGLIDSTANSQMEDDMSSSDVSSEDARTNKVVTGALNQGRRIDYMLQEKEIENANEYVAALAAHSSYWIEKDLSLFIARQIYLSTLEHAAEQEESEGWEPMPDSR